MGNPRWAATARVRATVTAAPEPSPEATGIVEDILISRFGNGDTRRRKKRLLMTEAMEWSEGSVLSSARRFTFGASTQIPARPEFRISTSAWTCVTGTAKAGRPYTTACSPNRMILPGAEDLVIGLSELLFRFRTNKRSRSLPAPTTTQRSARGGL